MLPNDSSQSKIKLDKATYQDKVVHEGMALWKQQKEFAKINKLNEQKENRDMLEKYWPWSRASDVKPRGFRNLRLEELFPNIEYQNAKRFVGMLDLERKGRGIGGGGAPICNRGNKITKIHEDPILRFQFGSKDLRRFVDNNLRYKSDREAQREYKKTLDKLVEEKKLNENNEKSETKIFHQKQGWSNEGTLKQLGNEDTKNNLQNLKNGKKLKDMKLVLPNKMVKFDPIVRQDMSFLRGGRNRKLSPLLNTKDEGVELVRLLAKNRKYPPRIPLCSSDVTSEAKMGKSTIWNRQGSAYLKQLTQQIRNKEQIIKDMKSKENDFVQRHFSTWDGFWGRPGHGAPLAELKKQSLDRLLYPQMFPIGDMKAKENDFVQRHFSTWDGFWGRPGHGAPLAELKKQSLERLLYPQMFPIGVC